MGKANTIELAAQAHSDLNLFAAIASILDGGFIHGGERTERVAERIVQMCQREQAHLLREYDAACAEASEPRP